MAAEAPPGRAPGLHGLLVVDKPGLPADPPTPLPRLLTSHDVVQQVRRWSGQRRIGHTGTLDPMASGVLVLCLGQATRLVEYYQGHDKTYLAEVRLGAATDTYDATGRVTETAPIPPLETATIERVLSRFQGDLLQTPPAYSALKQGGEALYRKARRGEAVATAPRRVIIYHLELLAWRPPDRLSVRVRCSAGTYLRSLAHDLGIALGTVAHLVALRREVAGAFTLDHAHTLEAVQQAAGQGALADLLLPMGTGLDLPVLLVDGEAARRLGHGQQVAVPAELLDSLPGSDGLAQALDPSSALLGIVRCLGATEGDNLLWKAEKWLTV
ncbi:MAG TPA: tRNA pseudouridine(55) synthase TruB [Caldilineaceae bacterium]|nr:tRNA pseudouridine(55) synthase TruB [Caldilineaceae bacterium]